MKYDNLFFRKTRCSEQTKSYCAAIDTTQYELFWETKDEVLANYIYFYFFVSSTFLDSLALEPYF